MLLREAIAEKVSTGPVPAPCRWDQRLTADNSDWLMSIHSLLPPARGRWGAIHAAGSIIAVNHRFHRRGVGGDRPHLMHPRSVCSGPHSCREAPAVYNTPDFVIPRPPCRR